LKAISTAAVGKTRLLKFLCDGFLLCIQKMLDLTNLKEK